MIIESLRKAVENSDVSEARLLCFHIVRNNWIIPMLREIQDPHASINCREIAWELFDLIDKYVNIHLNGKGWFVVGKGQSAGEYLYRNKYDSLNCSFSI